MRVAHSVDKTDASVLRACVVDTSRETQMTPWASARKRAPGGGGGGRRPLFRGQRGGGRCGLLATPPRRAAGRRRASPANGRSETSESSLPRRFWNSCKVHSVRSQWPSRRPPPLQRLEMDARAGAAVLRVCAALGRMQPAALRGKAKESGLEWVQCDIIKSVLREALLSSEKAGKRAPRASRRALEAAPSGRGRAARAARAAVKEGRRERASRGEKEIGTSEPCCTFCDPSRFRCFPLLGRAGGARTQSRHIVRRQLRKREGARCRDGGRAARDGGSGGSGGCGGVDAFVSLSICPHFQSAAISFSILAHTHPLSLSRSLSLLPFHLREARLLAMADPGAEVLDAAAARRVDAGLRQAAGALAAVGPAIGRWAVEQSRACSAGGYRVKRAEAHGGRRGGRTAGTARCRSMLALGRSWWGEVE